MTDYRMLLFKLLLVVNTVGLLFRKEAPSTDDGLHSLPPELTPHSFLVLFQAFVNHCDGFFKTQYVYWLSFKPKRYFCPAPELFLEKPPYLVVGDSGVQAIFHINLSGYQPSCVECVNKEFLRLKVNFRQIKKSIYLDRSGGFSID